MINAFHSTSKRLGGRPPRRSKAVVGAVLSALAMVASCIVYVALLPTLTPQAGIDQALPGGTTAQSANDGKGSENAQTDSSNAAGNEEEKPASEKDENSTPDSKEDDAANAADAEKSSDEEQSGLPEVSLAETPDISTQDEERQETEGNQADKTQSAGEKDQGGADKNEDSRPTGSTSQRPSTDASRPSNPGTSAPSEPTTEPEPAPEPTPDPEPEPTPEPEPEPEDPMLQEPSAEDEQVFRAFLADKASLIPGYVSQVNACVGTFEANCLTTDISVRLAGQSSCESLAYQLLNEYFAVRDHVRSNYSQYCDEQDELINMYRLLETYVECYYAAWTINLGFEDPSQHTSEFMAPLSGASSYLAEFDAYYAGFTI